MKTAEARNDERRQRSAAKRIAAGLEVPIDTACKAVAAFNVARRVYRENYRGHWSHAVDAGLEAAELVLAEAGVRGSGVESLSGQDFGDCKDAPGDTDGPYFVYINAGDTYKATLGFDAFKNALVVACWGDYAERLERKFGGRS